MACDCLDCFEQAPMDEPNPLRCEDCGVLLSRHGDECGYELGDHAAGYFEAPVWVGVD